MGGLDRVRVITLIFLLRHNAQPVLDLPMLPITIGGHPKIERRGKRKEFGREVVASTEQEGWEHNSS